MNELEQLEVSKVEALEAVSLRDALLRLRSTADYKLVFEKGLFEDFASQCVGALSAPTTQSEKVQAAIKADIAMIGTLHARLHSMVAIGDNAEYSIRDTDAEIDSLRETEL